MGRVDPHNDYRPVRLGEINTQTRWVLDRAEAREPDFLPHVMLRVSRRHARALPAGAGRRADARGRAADGARGPRPRADRRRRRRARGRDDRARARPPLHPRVARAVGARRADHASSAIVKVLQGELVCGDEDAEVSGQIWCMAMDIGSLPSEIGPGDVVVVGNRDDAQRAAIELGVGLLVTSNGTTPSRRHAGAGRRARRAGRALAAGQLRDRAHDHAVGAVPGAAGPEAADRPPRRPALRRRRRGQGGPLPRGGRRRRAPAPDRPRHPHRPGQPAPAPGAARRPRRAGPERAGRRAGRDRRDPRPPPHRLDRDDGARAGDVRPGRLDRDAGDRALPPERDGAEPLDGDRCCCARSSRTR